MPDYTTTPVDLDAAERDVAAWMHSLRQVEPSPLLGQRVLASLAAASPPRSYAWVGAIAAGLLLSIGLAGFSQAAAEASQAACSGALCAEPIVAVVDDPQVPLYQSLEALAAFDGDGGCWEALADLGGPR